MNPPPKKKNKDTAVFFITFWLYYRFFSWGFCPLINNSSLQYDDLRVRVTFLLYNPVSQPEKLFQSRLVSSGLNQQYLEDSPRRTPVTVLRGQTIPEFKTNLFNFRNNLY
jgi:hypothetical protein